MTVKEILTADLKPYENNPRKNDNAVEAVKKSIERFGFKVPLVIDSQNVIVAGHTRYKAAKLLKLEKIPCVIANDLTPEQIKAFRLADNKTAEFAEWDLEKLNEEVSKLIDFDMSEFGFEIADFQNFQDADMHKKKSKQKLDVGGEIDSDEFDDENFECTCPRCGFKFNR